MKYFNTAIIGTGYWGSIICKKLTEITKQKIIIYDKDKNNSNLLKKKFKKKIIIEKSINDILKNKSIKNIILATHPNINYKISKNILKKKNLFVEKPIVQNKNHLKHLIKIAKHNKKIFMGGYIYLFNPYIKKIKKILDSKKLGKIKFIDIQRKNLGPIRNKVHSHVDLGSHDISILLYLFNKKINVKKIEKRNILKNNISDISTINLKIDSIKCEINSSWLNPYKERKILIIGTKKMLVFNEMDESNKLKIFHKYGYYPKLKVFKKDYLSNKARIYSGKTNYIKVKNVDSLKEELKHFLISSQKKINPITNGLFCLKILKLIT